MVSRVSWVCCLCIHLCIFAWYVSVLSYETRFLTLMGLGTRNLSYGGQWKYLTYVNLVLQAVFFGLCVLTDVVHLTFPANFLRGGVQSLLVKLRDDIFTIFAFPWATLVFSAFWPAYALNRAQYTPLGPGAIAPPWLNHARHTMIVPLVLVQMYIQNHTYAPRLKSFPLILFAGVLYMSWLLWVHHVSGIWVYTFLANLSPLCVLFISGLCLGLLLLIYWLGEQLSGRIWGDSVSQRKRN